MVRILGHNIGRGGSPERAMPVHAGVRPTRDEEQFLGDLQAEEKATGFPPVVPGTVAKKLDEVYRRTGDPRFSVASGTTVARRP